MSCSKNCCAEKKEELRENLSTGAKVGLGFFFFLVVLPGIIGLIVFMRHKKRTGKVTGMFKK